MKLAQLLAAAVFTTSSFAPAPGFAAAASDCSCTTTGAASGQIVAAKGNVLTNGKNDFLPAAAGTPIVPGSEISVGAKSSASISIGTCALPLMSNSVTRVSSQKDGNLCVATVQTVTAEYGDPGANEIPGQGWDFWLWATFGVVTIGVTAVVLNELNDDGDSVSD